MRALRLSAPCDGTSKLVLCRPPMAPYKPSLLLVLILGALTAFTPMSVDMYLSSFPALE